jgi:tRNA A-37 threonylcarbamoyl transferase component Bud32
MQSPVSVGQLDDLLESSAKLYKHDRTTTVAAVKVGEQEFVLKRYNARNRWHKVKRAFRRTRARRSWQMSYAFKRAGLKVAQPVLMFEKRFGPVRQNAYFMNRKLQGDELLGLLPKMSSDERERVALEIKNIFEKMRRHKISHGDMKASNLIWQDKSLYFIDLDAAQKHITPIAWLAAHRKDKKRFLKNWQSQPHLLKFFEKLMKW